MDIDKTCASQLAAFDSDERTLIKTAYKALSDKFGKDITVLDIHNVSTIANCFIIASGGSAAQIKAMMDEVIEKLADSGLKLRHAEGVRAANWVLLDFNFIIIHIFDIENRAFYNLERIWSDGRVIPVEALTA